jgi:hypothetical protein
MAAVINMDDPEHQSCYWFFQNLHDADRVTWVVPGLIFFELQAVRARRKRDKVEDRPPYGRIPTIHGKLGTLRSYACFSETC